jgi:hypothetical protein
MAEAFEKGQGPRRAVDDVDDYDEIYIRVLVNNVRKVGTLILSRNYCYS